MFLSGGLSFGFQVNMFVTTASDRFYILTPSLSIQNNSKLIICLNLVLNSWFTRNTICVCFDSFSECRSKNEMPSMYPQAKGILHAFKDKGVNLAIASRSPTPDIANAFLQKLGIKSMFVAQEIFSSWTHKTEHFQKINRKTGVPYNEMLFFDDENRNIQAVSKMGVTSILVGKGVNLGALRQGLSEFVKNSASVEKNKEQWRKFSKDSGSSKSDTQWQFSNTQHTNKGNCCDVSCFSSQEYGSNPISIYPYRFLLKDHCPNLSCWFGLLFYGYWHFELAQ